MKPFNKRNLKLVLFNVLLTIICFTKLSYCEKIDIETYCTRIYLKAVCTGLDFGSLDLEFETKELLSESTVIFEDSNLATIPHDLFRAFPAANYIEFVNCKIKSLHKWNFKDGYSALTLNLRSNEIQKLTSEVFINMKGLYELDLENNLLNEFDADCFDGLSKLTTLVLSSNNISHIPLTLFNPLEMLQRIYLDDNHIEVISNDIFKFNKQLGYINLEKNNIKVFSQNIVRHLDTRLILRLSFNPIETPNIINYDQLTISYTKIKSIIITETADEVVATHCQITDVVFKNAKNIRKLDLSYNRISNITNITSYVDNNYEYLYILNLSHNPIGRINVKSFSKFTSLRELYLSGTNLLGLDYGSFPFQYSELEVLDISYNNLKTFDLEMLSYQKKLKQLYLDGNQLSELNYENIREYFEEFKEIGISNNNWNCTFLREMIVHMHRKSVEIRVPEVVNNTIYKPIGGVTCIDGINYIESNTI